MDGRKAVGEALTGAHAGQPSSCEIRSSGVPTPLAEAEGHTDGDVTGEPLSDPAQSETLYTRGNSSHGNREIPAPPASGIAGRPEKATSRTSGAHGVGKSEGGVVPKNSSNKGGLVPPAETGEGRPPAEGNTTSETASRTQSRGLASTDLGRVREVARKDKKARFTALLHHITIPLLFESFFALKRGAAPGIDGVTWERYEADLEDRVVDLHRRVHAGTYRALPSRRVFIPKADGRMRPLGVAALEDKVVQQAVAKVLGAIWEVDFLGLSYGFRPGRGPHDALDALWVGLMRKKVNWVIDADIQGFFDAVSHEWLWKFVEHRVADRRMLRLIRKWLRVGVSEDGQWSKTEVGTPQGSVISPFLANVYLHYVLDLWVNQWRKRNAKGDVLIVRYADDFVLGFQHRHEAEQFLGELRERLETFGLRLHPEKTRLIEFSRLAAWRRWERGEGRRESFDFLGFTHRWVRKHGKEGFIVRRTTAKKRLRAKLTEVGETLRKHRHAPLGRQGQWLGRVVRGYFAYHAVPGNMASLAAFREQAVRHWLQALRRRGQKGRMNWERFRPLIAFFVPRPKIQHPYPNVRFDAKHPR
ncbi:group II intron reverse transcriptase/maturase [Urbifossiella limnaea]|uniref:group II intron reverse transcriptase/maturase n=1 Tax=Urbifossiella limnaea TaxID=2528023 RepID=UPI0036F38E75